MSENIPDPPQDVMRWLIDLEPTEHLHDSLTAQKVLHDMSAELTTLRTQVQTLHQENERLKEQLSEANTVMNAAMNAELLERHDLEAAEAELATLRTRNRAVITHYGSPTGHAYECYDEVAEVTPAIWETILKSDHRMNDNRKDFILINPRRIMDGQSVIREKYIIEADDVSNGSVTMSELQEEINNLRTRAQALLVALRELESEMRKYSVTTHNFDSLVDYASRWADTLARLQGQKD